MGAKLQLSAAMHFQGSVCCNLLEETQSYHNSSRLGWREVYGKVKARDHSVLECAFSLRFVLLHGL